jgi:hypothetical protein
MWMRLFKASASRLRRASAGGKKFLQKFSLFTLAAVPLLLAAQMSALGQINTATLSGNVKDANGAAVPGASVLVLQVSTGVSRTVTANDSGFFNVSLLQPGDYSVSVSKDGFKTATESIQLHVDQSADLDFALVVGSVQEKVTVTDSVPDLQTGTSALGTVIGQSEVQDLPLNGRQFVQLLQLAPGTVPVSVSQTAVPQVGSAGSNVTPSINGGSGRSNLFFVDGLYATDPFFTSLSISPSVDAIREFQEQTHTDEAQFGGSIGATVNLATKGGSNEFHGSGYEFFRNQDIAATPYFASVKGGYRQSQFGGSLGGPIKRNKLFFFGYYDGYRQAQAANNFSILPTAAELGGNFSALLPSTIIYDPTTYNATTRQAQPFPGNVIPTNRLNQGILATLQAYVPTATSNVVNANNYVNTASSTNNQDQYSARVDYSIGAKDSLFARWSVNENTNVGPGQLPANPFVTGFNGNNSGGSWVHTFSSLLIMQISAGYNSIAHPQEYLEPNAASVFQSGGYAAGFTDTPGGILVPKTPGIHPSGFFDLNAGWGPIGPQRLYQISGSVTKTTGRHTLTFGAAYYHTWMYTNWAENDIDFNQQATWNPCGSTNAGTCVGQGGNSLASMLLGLPDSASRQLGNAGVNLFSSVTNAFVQDSWKLNPKLTVNLGLRWDYTTPIGETSNRLAGFDVHTGEWYLPKNDADTPSGPLPTGVVILPRNTITTPDYKNFGPRAGFAYQVVPGTVVSAGTGVVFDSWSGALQAAQNARGAWPSGSSQGPTNLNIAGVTPGVTAQNPFGSTQPIIPSTPFPSGGGFLDTAFKNAYSLQWNLQLQQQLGNAGSVKFSYVGSSTSRAPIQIQSNVSLVLGPTQDLPFQQMQQNFTEIRSIGHMSYNAFQAQYTKQYSSGLALRSSFTWSKNINAGCASFWEGCNIQDPYVLRSNRSVDDIDVPVVFTTSAVYQLPLGANKKFATSGISSKILGGWQVNGIVAARGGQPFTPLINFDNANSNGATQRPDVVGSTVGTKSLTEYFNTAAYAIAPPYSYGTAGRNSLRGPGYTDVDFSLFRDFPIFERVVLQLRAESFNILNHPNFANPDSTFEDANFGKITAINSSSSPREFQFAGRLTF